MSHNLRISGPPRCGKTIWILNQFQGRREPCGYLRFFGKSVAGLFQLNDSGIDCSWLQVQCPGLLN